MSWRHELTELAKDPPDHEKGNAQQCVFKPPSPHHSSSFGTGSLCPSVSKIPKGFHFQSAQNKAFLWAHQGRVWKKMKKQMQSRVQGEELTGVHTILTCTNLHWGRRHGKHKPLLSLSRRCGAETSLHYSCKQKRSFVCAK